MESLGSQVVVIFMPSFGDEDKLREAIANYVESGVSQNSIVIKNKSQGVSAYVELPSNKAQELCQKKKLTILDMNATVKRFYCDHQIFINKLPKDISENDVKQYFGQFGIILNVDIVNTKHSFEPDKFVDMRHCYIQLQDKNSAQKIIYHHKRHFIKKQEIKIHKTYNIGQSQDTDKKLFVRVFPKTNKIEETQAQLMQLFKKYGELRQRLKLEESKDSLSSIVVFTSNQGAEKVFQNMKQTQIGDLKVILQPNSADFSLFVSGIKNEFSPQQIKEIFSKYGKIFDIKIKPKRNSPALTAVIYYSNEEDAKKVLAEYPTYKQLNQIFLGKPYLTVNMTPKEMKGFQDAQKKNFKGFKNPPGPVNYGMMPPPPNQQFYPYPPNFNPANNSPMPNHAQRPNIKPSNPL